MTDYNSVKNQLVIISQMTEEEIEKYENCINSSIEYVFSALVSEEYCNDSRVIHLCAVNAFLKIALIKEADSDGISSFSAGDVSFSRDASSLDRIKLLYELARDECKDMVVDNGFSFKVV